MIITIFVFLLILSVLVLIHEAGHFFMARKFGIKVEEFGFGFPPRAFGIKIGETIYSINWLPIGGFVKLYGEDEAGGGRVATSDPFVAPLLRASKRPVRRSAPQGEQATSDRERAFFARPSWQRAIVVFAGVAMNFLLSVAILSYLLGFVGISVPGNKVIVAGVAKDSPAFIAGIKVGDNIEALNNILVKTPQELIILTKKHLGEEITLRIKDKEGEKNIVIVPRREYPKNEGPIGVAIAPNIEIKKYPWYQAPFAAVSEAFNQVTLIVKGFSGIVSDLFVRGEVPKGVAGPLGIAQLTGQFVKVGPVAVLSLLSLLSLNLAVLNILPIPALDGGRLFFILVEMVTRKKVSRRFESMAHAFGMIILLTLIVFITLSDIVRIFTGQPILPR